VESGLQVLAGGGAGRKRLRRQESYLLVPAGVLLRRGRGADEL